MLTKKITEKFVHDVFFDKKQRKIFKNHFLKIQKEILQKTNATVKPTSKKEYENRALTTSALSFSVKGLSLIKDADEFDKDIYLTNCKFELYKKGRIVVFENSFLKPLKNEFRTSYLIFPNGPPGNGKKKGFIHKFAYPVYNFKKIDSGTFSQKVSSFSALYLTFKGNKTKYSFLLKMIKGDDENLIYSYWVSNYSMQK